MKFQISSQSNIIQGGLSYVLQDYAFQFTPSNPEVWSLAVSSIALDTLQLAMSQDGQILYTWGYFPHLSWVEANVSPPSYQQSSLFVESAEITPGVSLALEEAKNWKTLINPATGWICFGSHASISNQLAIEFASNCIAILAEHSLKAVWLHPAIPQKIRFNNAP